jgi:hypothetical protein
MQRSTWPEGKYCDRWLRAGGEVVECGWRSNIVVDRCRMLLAAFMRRDGAAAGIQALAVGRGDPSWDTALPPPTPGIEQLVDTSPVTIPIGTGDLSYLDAAGNPTAGPTPRLQVMVTLAPGTPPPEMGSDNYPLREFALIGDFGGTPYMIDYVRHAVIHKAAGDSLVRTIRLIF